jgi:hypothetical protein
MWLSGLHIVLLNLFTATKLGRKHPCQRFEKLLCGASLMQKKCNIILPPNNYIMMWVTIALRIVGGWLISWRPRGSVCQ